MFFSRKGHAENLLDWYGRTARASSSMGFSREHPLATSPAFRTHEPCVRTSKAIYQSPPHSLTRRHNMTSLRSITSRKAITHYSLLINLFLYPKNLRSKFCVFLCCVQRFLTEEHIFLTQRRKVSPSVCVVLRSLRAIFLTEVQKDITLRALCAFA